MAKRKPNLASDTPAPQPPTAPYRPTLQEHGTIAAHEKRRSKKPSTRIKVTETDGRFSIAPDHQDIGVGSVTLMNALGTTSVDFLNGFLGQMLNALSQGPAPQEAAINFGLAVVNGIEPRDEIEAMLAAQMAAVHMATMTFARRLNHVENLQQQDSAERAFNKLARTFTTQVEALKRYRSDGQQTVRVERVTVEAGGQAIVGAVTHAPAPGGRGQNEK